MSSMRACKRNQSAGAETELVVVAGMSEGLVEVGAGSDVDLGVGDTERDLDLDLGADASESILRDLRGGIISVEYCLGSRQVYGAADSYGGQQ